MKGRIEASRTGGDERGEARRKLYLPTHAGQAHGSTPVEVLDLSSSGMLVRTTARLDLDEPLCIVLGDEVERTSTIVWHAGRLYGCRFETPLSPAELGANLLRAHPPRDRDPAVYGAGGQASESLGQRIQRLRTQSPYSMVELARLAGVTKPTLWKWETGKAHPRHGSLTLLAAALGVEEAELLYGSTLGRRSDTARDGHDAQTLAATVGEARRAIAAIAGVEPAQVTIAIDFN